MKRFYREVALVESAGGFAVALDGRAVKTAGGNAQVAPTQALGEALAEEWREQTDAIDPARFRFRDLADYAVDIATPDRAGVIAKLIAFAETDTLCYRADPGDALLRRQQEIWEPLLVALETQHGIRFLRISGIIHQPQPAATLDALRAHLQTIDPFALAALQLLASLASSLVIALHALEGSVANRALWDAANLEEDWQAEKWGHDGEAEKLRQRRRADFLAGCEFAQLVRG